MTGLPANASRASAPHRGQRTRTSSPATAVRKPGTSFAWAVALFLFLLPFAGLAPFTSIRFGLLATPPRPPNQPPDPYSLGIVTQPDVLLALAFLIWAGLAVQGAAIGRQGRVALAALAVVGVGTLLGGALATAGSDWPHASFVGLSFRLAAIALGMAVILARPSADTARLWARALVLGVGLVAARAAVVYVETFGDVDARLLPALRSVPEFQGYQTAFFGTSGENSSALLMVIPVAATLAFLERRWIWKLVAIASLAAMLVNMAFSFQRWSLVVLAVGLVLILWHWGLSRRGVLISVGLIALFVKFGGTFMTELGPYFTDALDPTSGSSIAGRSDLIGEGIALMLDRPTGWGFGAANSLGGFSESSSHNQFVDIGVEGGVLIFALWIGWSGFVAAKLGTVMLRQGRHDLAFSMLLGVVLFEVKGLSSAASLVGPSGTWIWLALWFVLPALAITQIQDADPVAPGPIRALHSPKQIRRTHARSVRR